MDEVSRTVAERMEIGHNKDRPNIQDYIERMFDGFLEFHGDRYYGDDHAICGGIARLDGVPVTVIGHRKGKSTNENIKANFGMANPEGYRKALRLMHQAEKFHRPVICLVDTPGAYCGIGAEERGQGEAIARNLMEMMSLKTPVVSVVTGEGGSGGALGLAVANEVFMLENAVYSVISPKGCASILWKDASREMDAAEQLRITARDLKDLGVIEGIIPEPEGGAHTDPQATAEAVKAAVTGALSRLSGLSGDALYEARYQKFRQIGVYSQRQ